MRIPSVLLFATITYNAGANNLSIGLEEESLIYLYQNAKNGSTPLWNYGSTNIARAGDRLFVTSLNTLAEMPPLNNTRCGLFEKSAKGWKVISTPLFGRTREPCPIVVLPKKNKLLVSDNPAETNEIKAGGAPTMPAVVEFKTDDVSGQQRVWHPKWGLGGVTGTLFNEHSYRSFSADANNNQWVLIQNSGNKQAHWYYRDEDENIEISGVLKWPQFAGRPDRLCYASVAIVDGAVFFMGVSDIVEPNDEWLAKKKLISGRDRDYVFRRLYFSWTPDITKKPFAPWLKMADRERTAGNVVPGDIWLDATGRVHLVWEERALDGRVRDAYFANDKQKYEINYAIVDKNGVADKHTLIAVEGDQRELHLPRFFIGSDGRLFVFFSMRYSVDGRKFTTSNHIAEIVDKGKVGVVATIPFLYPFGKYMTTSSRNGSTKIQMLEIIGESPNEKGSIRYARVAIH